MRNLMNEQRTVNVGPYSLSNVKPLTIIAGPCQLETREHALEMAGALKALGDKLNIRIIYKTSYDKANRTSVSGVRGIGLEDALPIFNEIRDVTGLPVLTDVHEAAHCAAVAEAVDVLQIPAFLCRQTDLLLAAGHTGKAINIKKGQFLAPWDMKNVVDKVMSTGNEAVTVTERGASFGYNTLVTDFRGLPTMKNMTGCPVVFDATHSVQQPGGQGSSSGGQREFAPVLARAAVSLGIAAVFMETHQDPDNAPSDGPNMIPINRLEGVLKDLIAFDTLAKSSPAPETLANND
jgi:2-dehydro-3-deoxyphosphooctonate aldolase (KDO 8-P synthase)